MNVSIVPELPTLLSSSTSDHRSPVRRLAKTQSQEFSQSHPCNILNPEDHERQCDAVFSNSLFYAHALPQRDPALQTDSCA
jgi:hypothetical protein